GVVGEIRYVRAALVRIVREINRARRTGRRLRCDVQLADEPTFTDLAIRVVAWLANVGSLEHLHAVVAAIAAVEEPVARQFRAVNRASEVARLELSTAELVCPRCHRLALGSARRSLLANGVLSVRAEMADVFSGGGVDNEDAPVAVAIGNVETVRIGVNAHVSGKEGLRRTVHAAVRVVAVRALYARPADLHDEGAVALEL